MSEHVHFAYKNDGVKTVEIDLSSVAEYLPPKALVALRKAIQGAISPLVKELSNLREVVGSQAERISELETQQATNIRNLEIAFSANVATNKRVEALEPQQTTTTANIEVLFRMNATIKARMEEEDRKRKMRRGPKTEQQIEKIDSHLSRSPKKRASFMELRQLLGCSKSRLSNILTTCNERYHVLLNAHDRRMKLLQLKPNI